MNESRKAREEYIDREPPMLKHLVKLFGQKLCSIHVADIGACEGLSSIQYAKWGIGGEYWLFEPKPDNLACIWQNIREFNYLPLERYHVIPYAICAVDGWFDFWESAGDAGVADWDTGNKSSSLRQPTWHLQEHQWCRFNPTVTEVRRLDSFELDLDFIHIDVQGGELDVFAGGSQTMRGVKAVWCELALVEQYHGQPLKADVDRYMAEMGFHNEMEQMAPKWGDVLYAR